MEPKSNWKSFFAEWPSDLLRNGIVVTDLNEQIPFKAFMITEAFMLLERTNPDPLGTRAILLPYDRIAVVKLTAVPQEKIFAGIGFIGKLAGR